MRFIKNNLFILILLVVVSFFLIPNLSFAQTDLGLEPVAETGLGSSSLPELIVRIIQIALGFLGILALIVILYGGYTWLSSGGNQDKVADAKKILVNGVIGLVIILSAFSIVTFLITRIFDATGGEALYCEIGQVEECSMSGDCEREKTCIDNGEGNGVWGDCEIIYSGECSPLSDSEFFRLTATAPANGDELNIANVVVQLTFNNNVGDFNAIDLSEGEGVTIVQRSTNNLVPLVGEVSNNPKKLNIYPDKDQAGYACTGHPDLACFPYDSIDDLNNWYTVTVLTEGVVLTNSSGTEVSCLDIPCVFEFKTGFSVDTENPVVDLISAVSNGQFDWNNSDNIDINISESFLFNSQASDDAGLASSNFFENQITLSSTPDLGQGLFLSLIPWSPEDLGYQVSDVKQVGAEVTDYAGNSTQSIKQVTLFSATCYNEIQDGDEIGIDCGGSCPACSDENVDNPIITSIDPPNGASGNWITIYGSGFGESQGTIKYRDQLGNINYIGVPSLGMLVCESPWNDTWIIMEIPDIDLGLVDLQVVRFNSSISSNWYEDFDVNTIQRPGICLMTSDDGYYNDELNIIGHSFGDNTDVRDIFFGQSVERVSASNQSFSIEGSIEHAYGNVPYLESGQTVVRVEIDGEESNGLYFTVIDSNQESSISFSPDSGNVGEYITIYGSGFGDFKGEGTVYFNNNIEGSFDFPDACGTNYWSDDQIVVKVPVGSSDGALRVETDSGYVVTSSTFFDFNNTLDISPGICSITPNSGLIDTPVYIAGEFSEDVLVNFSGIELSDVDIDNNEITILVPNVSSGLVNLEEPTGAESNSVNFSVGQTSQGGEPNDDYFEWQFTTCEDCLIPEVEENGICSNGDLASPSPRPYSTDGFIDQDVTITFNSTMDHSTFIANDSVILEVCDGLEVNCTSSNWSFVLGDNRNSVVLNPDNDFNADTWYRITLTEDIANFEYNMDAEYSWSFKTAQENLQCTADSVIISPYDRREGSTLGPIELNEYVNYSASGVNSNNCASCSDDFEWEWESNDPGAVISDTNLSTNQLHAEGLISSNQEIIIAQIIDVEPYPIGNAYLNIVEETGNQDNEPGDDQLLLVDYQPVGDQVCLNTLAQVEFNHGLSDNGLSQFSFFKCSTSEGDCPTLGEGGNWISAGSDITFNNNNTLVSMSPSSGLLDPDFDYRIIMYSGDPDILGESRISTDDGLFLNQEGCEYGGGNWFQGMQWCYWIFSTVDERCEVDSIGISPNNVINNINDTQDWQATAYDQEGLALTDVVDSWTVNDSEIASIVDNGDNTATTDSLSSGSTWLYTDIDIDNIRGEAWLEVEPSIVNPQIISTQPIGQEYFCTNSLVEVTFDQYLKRETVNQNTFELNQFSDTDLGGCIAFDETIAFGEPTNLINKFTDVYFNKFISNLTSKLVNYVFNKVYAIVPDWIPQSGYWCPLNNSGEWILDNIGGEGRVKFQLNEVLPGNSSIQVLIQGGQGGVLSIQDLPLDINSDTYDYYFNTSDTYCELSFLQVSTDLETYSPEYTFNISEDSSNLDENDPLSGNFDTINDYDKAFYVTGFSQNGQALTSVPGEYEWIWRWNSEDTSIALTTDSVNYSEYYDADYDGNYNVVLAANNNGETDITAHAVFIDNSSLAGTGQVIVDLCENPWPAVDITNLDNTYYEDTNFSFGLSYCRDAGLYGFNDDLPSLGDISDNVTLYNISADDLLKEYLMPVGDDLIGLRVYTNDNHLSPAEWYSNNIPELQQGNLSYLIVDGYQAIQDGRTIYVAATSVTNDNISIYSDIFLLSYNSEASAETVNIYNQLIDRWIFNTNILEENKGKLIRDLKRLNDLTYIKEVLNNYNAINNTYPILSGGTFLTGMSTSKWPSWNNTFSSELNASLPIDPINQFNACADCTSSSDASCDNYDINTCWNPDLNNGQGNFSCDAGSYFYRYQYSYNAGPDYLLAAKMEFPYVGNIASTWNPSFDTNHLYLSTEFVEGCGFEFLGQVCGNGSIEGSEECELGDSINYCGYDHAYYESQLVGCSDIDCTWAEDDSGVCGGYCGDGNVDSFEDCDGGINCSDTCDFIPYCGDNIAQTYLDEECDGSDLGNFSCSDNSTPSCNTSCEISCPSGELYGGSCGNNIKEGTEECDGLDTPPNTSCNTSCEVTSCTGSYLACDGNLTDLDGCEVDILSDEYNCTACGNSCYDVSDINENTLVECTQYINDDGDDSAVCSYGCNPYDTWLNCDYSPAGCESNYLTDSSNCNVCGNDCSIDPGTIIQADLDNNIDYFSGSPYPAADTTIYTCENGGCGFICEEGSYANCDEVSDCETILYNDSEITCGECGNGVIEGNEQCELGDYSAELVFVFDISTSMDDDAAGLCSALDSLSQELDEDEINYMLTVMTLNGGVGTTTVGTTDAYDALVTDCDIYGHDNIQHFNFYDNSSNNISVDVEQTCGVITGAKEHWGYATNIIAQSYNWNTDYSITQKIIVPVSNEGPWCGGGNTSNDSTIDSEDISIVSTAITTALNNSVLVSPVIIQFIPLDYDEDDDDYETYYYDDNEEPAQSYASLSWGALSGLSDNFVQTGGIYTNSSDNWSSTINTIITGSTCTDECIFPVIE